MTDARVVRVRETLTGTDRRRWITVFVLATVVSWTWALATPYYGAPDEPDHTTKAAAVARGQILGQAVEGEPDYKRLFRIPGPFSVHKTGCFAWDPQVSAACQITDDTKPEVAVISNAGRYPPLYYALVGWATLPLPITAGFYAMRLVTGLLCAGFVASAAVTASRLAARRWAGLGLAVALTPMCWYLFGTVNPSSLEIAAAIGLWLAGYGLVTGSDKEVDVSLVRRAAAAGATLALTRAFGPAWLAVMAVTLLICVQRASLLALLRSRAARWGAAVVVLATVAQTAWVLIIKPMDIAGWTEPTPGAFPSLYRTALGWTYANGVLPMIGVFDWMTTFAPNGTYVLWYGLLGLLVLVAWGLAGRRTALAVIAVLITAVFLPPAIEAFQAPRVGFFGWQGRYTLPIGVGVPLLAAAGVGRRGARLFEGSRLYAVAAALIALGQTAAIWAALQRNTVGLMGPMRFWQHGAWHPPVNALVLLIVFAVAMSALSLVLVTRHPDEVAMDPPVADDPEETSAVAPSEAGETDVDRDPDDTLREAAST